VGVLEGPEKTGLAIITAIIAEAILGRIYFGQWPHLASAYVSGISVGILIRSPYPWVFALTSLLSIMSKYVLRLEGRHLWNPSNFGIAAMLIVAHEYTSTLTIQFGNSIAPMIVIWVLGSFIISRLKRFHICATYVASFFFFAWVRSLITGHGFWTEAAPITGPMYQLFTFFMITDPKTTVRGTKAQMLVAFLVAAMECVLRLMGNIHAPYYALFTVGPVTNLIEIWLTKRKKGAPVTPSAAPATA
jgi:enediyne biosynthesis protein E5